jgi:peptidoglycan/LPS O-acetylase OafA/YrhL
MLSTESRTEAVPERRVLRRSRAETREWLQDRIDGRVALVVGVAWFVLNQIAYALEPAAQQSEPFIGILLEITMYVLLAGMLAGLVMQHRWGLLASFAAAILATAASIACPVTGHHSFGTWWFGQMACMLGLVAISAVALRRNYSS